MHDIDFAALRASRARPAADPIQSPQSSWRRDWLRHIAILAIAFVAAWLIFGNRDSGPAPTPIDADGLHVLIVRDPDKKDITAGQASVQSSTLIDEWCKANNAKFRRFDKADELDAEDRVWREMRATVTDPPSMVTLRNGRASVGPIPDGIEAAKTQLERLK